MGMVFDIKRGSIKDGPGFRTSVFLKGCPLRCAWCHNPESQSPRPQTSVSGDEACGSEFTVEDVLREVRRDKVFYAQSGGGMTLTGGEPMMQPDFALDLAASAKREGISVAVDTCGFAPWSVFERILPVTDLFLYDLKCMDAEKHRKLTGVDNALILENLAKLDAAGKRLWIRAPLVPGLNDTDDDLAALRARVEGLKNVEKFEICPYHPIGLEKYAKFGMTPPYAEREQPSAEMIRRWEKMLSQSEESLSVPMTASCCGMRMRSLPAMSRTSLA